MSAFADLRAALKRAPLRTLPRRALLRARYGRSRLDAGYLEARTLADLREQGAAALRTTPQPAGALDVAFVVPPFTNGSGGHTTLSNIVRALERRGHRVSLWLDDPGRRLKDLDEAARDFKAWFGPFAAPVHARFDGWSGADVAVATGYQSVLKVRTLPDAGARAYLVQDHEPEFFATSTERLHAEESYGFGLHAITAGVWLAQFMSERYGMRATPFELAVDHAIYRPHEDEPRSGESVIFYARSSTSRRAVPLGLSALRDLKARRPGLDVRLYGQPFTPQVDFPATNLGVVAGPELAREYARATVGLCLSLTNYSLVPQEMLACGLANVELRTPSVVEAFGEDGPVLLAEPEPKVLADALERLLDDAAERERRAAEGQTLVAARTWDAAGEAVERGLRAALEERAG